MLWVKHMTRSSNDEKLSKLTDEAGLEGYGFWWRIIEIIGEQVDEFDKHSVTFPLKKWGNLLGISPKKFRTLAELCANFELIFLKFEKNNLTISIPNILKYRDEWTERKSRNSGVAREKLRTTRARLTDTYIDKELPPLLSPPKGERNESVVSCSENFCEKNSDEAGQKILERNFCTENSSTGNSQLHADFVLPEFGQEQREDAMQGGIRASCEQQAPSLEQQERRKSFREPSGYFKQLRQVYNRLKDEGNLVGWEEFRIFEKDRSNPDVLTLISDIEARAETEQWQKGYIPSLAKYLRCKLWEQPLEELNRKKGGELQQEAEDFVAFRTRLEREAKEKNGTSGVKHSEAER